MTRDSDEFSTTSTYTFFCSKSLFLMCFSLNLLAYSKCYSTLEAVHIAHLCPLCSECSRHTVSLVSAFQFPLAMAFVESRCGPFAGWRFAVAVSIPLNTVKSLTGRENHVIGNDSVSRCVRLWTSL